MDDDVKTGFKTSEGDTCPAVNEPSSLIFFNKKEEIIRLEKGKFIWKGREVKDVNKIYERFSEYMGMVEKKKKANAIEAVLDQTK